jgi:hypothetical protein
VSRLEPHLSAPQAIPVVLNSRLMIGSFPGRRATLQHPVSLSAFEDIRRSFWKVVPPAQSNAESNMENCKYCKLFSF